MVLTICCAYPLTRKSLRGRAAINTLIIITLYFSGGILPTYVLVKSLGLLNTMWSLVLPVAINPFNLIILRTSFSLDPGLAHRSRRSSTVPRRSRSSSRIIVPLSMAILATLALFYAVFRWNGFQDALFYVTKPALYTLQLKLSFIVLDNTASEVLQAEGALAKERIVPAAITAATVIVATVPILVDLPVAAALLHIGGDDRFDQGLRPGAYTRPARRTRRRCPNAGPRARPLPTGGVP